MFLCLALASARKPKLQRSCQLHAIKVSDCLLETIKCLQAYVNFSLLFNQEQRHATKDNVQRKQARAEGEHEESDNEISASESDDDDDDDIPYNPKNLPLGWDGKVGILPPLM